MKKGPVTQSEKPNGALMSHWFQMTQLFPRATLSLHFNLLSTLKKAHSHSCTGLNRHNIHPFTQKAQTDRKDKARTRRLY